jgi:anti-anti-sigma factor
VRSFGLLSEPAGVEDADHVCWVYDDDGSFEAAAIRFLGAGLDRGERLLWVGDGMADRLGRASGPLSAVDDLVGRGTLELVPLSDGYDAARTFSPEQQLEFYDGRTRQALAEGHSGLRVVAEVTRLAGDPQHAADFVRWEHLADDYVAHGPGFSAFCAYRSADVPADVVADAAAVHPLSSVHGSPPLFRLWFEDERIVVAGQVDTSASDRFGRLLGSTHVDAPVVTVDLSRLDFIDLAGTRVVASFARSVTGRGARLVIVGASRLFCRMWRIVGLGGLPGVSFTRERS